MPARVAITNYKCISTDVISFSLFLRTSTLLPHLPRAVVVLLRETRSLYIDMFTPTLRRQPTKLLIPLEPISSRASAPPPTRMRSLASFENEPAVCPCSVYRPSTAADNWKYKVFRLATVCKIVYSRRNTEFERECSQKINEVERFSPSNYFLPE